MATKHVFTATECRRVSLFRNGVNQALRIPKEYELPTQEATLYRDGDRLIIEPFPHPPSLLATLDALEALDESFPDVDELLLPAKTVNLT